MTREKKYKPSLNHRTRGTRCFTADEPEILFNVSSAKSKYEYCTLGICADCLRVSWWDYAEKYLDGWHK